jgi:pimeloyl-ACP methyl ester carboxylesterase
VDLPRTQYAKSDGVNVACQVLGDGPFDLVFVPGSLSHVELGWRIGTYSRLLGGLAGFSRLILFDKRGTGHVSGAGDRPRPIRRRGQNPVSSRLPRWLAPRGRRED